jgi:hypothetical protein
MLLAQNPLLWFGPLIGIALATFWIGLLYSMSALGGWRRLARAYPAVDASATTQDMSAVRRFHFCSGGFTWVNYSACLTFSVDRDYLHLAVQLPIRPAHPPLSIPWSEISATEKRAFLNSGTVLSFERAPGVRLLISNRLALKLIRAARSCEAVTSFSAEPQ